MKRFYCDLCENEMRYDDKPVGNTNAATNTVLVNLPHDLLEVTLQVTIRAHKLHQPIDTRPGWKRGGTEDLPPPVRKHADLCGPCRWALLEQLRGGHSPSNDTPLPAIKSEIAWGNPDD